MYYKKHKMKRSPADDAFSLFIRLRDSDENGFCTCCSCGKILYYKDLDCGHFVNRQHKSLRFSEINCNAQCKYCNGDEGNSVGYSRFLIAKYGADILDKLEIEKKKTLHLTAFDEAEIAKFYRAKVRELKKQKGLK